MVRKSKVLSAVAATATAVGMAAWAGSAVAGTTPVAAPAPAPTVAGPLAGLEPGMIAAMRRDLRLSDDQIAIRLSSQAGAGVTEKRLRAALGTKFAGAWIPAGKQRLMVAVTDAKAAATVRADGAEATVVARDERRLLAAKEALDSRAARAPKGIHSWYVDPASNTVVVLAASAAQPAATAFVKTSGVDAAAVRVVSTTEEAPHPMFDVRGGDQYVINGNTLCSIGFSVNGGFVTAGHCGSVGSPTLGFNNVAQGTFRGSSFPGNDYAWVQTNGSWTPRPLVNNYAGGNVTVAGSQEAPIGSSVCRSGRTTGWRCGTIQAKNVSVSYPQGVVSGLTQTDACAEGGDSGGSWITGDQAQGVTSGGSGNCTSGGTTFFQPVNEILGAFGLSLVTAGGGGSSSRVISSLNNKCIDVPGGNFAVGQRLVVWDCTGGPNQSWEFVGGTLRTQNNLCMDVANASTAAGAAIQIVSCNGNAAQQFVLTGAGDLVNPQSNKCVDIDGWNPDNGALLIQWDCTGGANQKWRRG
jgi:streptogrisin C